MISVEISDMGYYFFGEKPPVVCQLLILLISGDIAKKF
jgi:hypothetical protein